jgi:hypothetical protein
VFSLDALRLAGPGGPANYIYTNGNAIYPDGGVDRGTYYRFRVSDSGGTVRNGSFPCTPASAFSRTENRYVVAPTDPVSTRRAWKYTLQQFNNAKCARSPVKTATKRFYVARATVFADSGLKTPKTLFSAGQTAYVVVSGVKPSTRDWSASWIAPSGSTVRANTAGPDRADSSRTGRLPKRSSTNLQYMPSPGKAVGAWNREVNYETRRAALATANAGAWRLRLRLDATNFVGLAVFSVDATPPPMPTIFVAPTNPSSSRGALFGFSSSESDVNFTCRLDGAALSLCSSPVSYTGLGDGPHTFVVRAGDSAGNESAITSYTWVVDATAPTVTLTTPANGSTTNDSTPTFAGRAGTNQGDSGNVTVNVYAGASASGTPLQRLTATATGGSYSTDAPSALADGTYTAQAEQVDMAGNVGRSVAATVAVNTDVVVLAAGDIAGCDTFGDEATALVLDRLPGTVVPVGDLVYDDGTAQEFADCYDPTWGRHKARTRPVVGGHEYRTPGAAAYFAYWGAVAGDPAKGYYSYDLGSWHVIALNAQCAAVGGCGTGSPEELWLRSDLAAHPARCTLAFLPAPRFSSGNIHGSNPDMQPFWQALYDAGAELVVSGHEHIYERFAPQTPTGSADAVRGIREIIAGTGGRSHYGIGTIKPNSEVRNTDTFGILKLALHSFGYDWNFVPEAGKTFTDSGSGTCH